MAHITDLGFTAAELAAAVEDGHVRVQKHPTKPLFIYNYTENCQFSKRWNNITLQCRGLILDEYGEIVARPWKKFFNFGERDLEIDFNAPVEVTDKMDGSLGILYHDGDNWAIATRGSFASEQAVHATKLLHQNYRQYFLMWQEALTSTFLFEIVYPSNRIVVNYGDTDDLFLLGGVNKQWGYCYGPNLAADMLGWNGPVTETFEYRTFGEAISAADRAGKEGIVIRSGSKMVKLKQAGYVELHRIVTNLSPRTIWAQMGAGKTVADICEQIPDEFHGYVKDIGDDLLSQASSISSKAQSEFFDITMKMFADGKSPEDGRYRRDFAAHASKSANSKYLFLLLDNKDIGDVVWQSIKPRGDAKLVTADE